MSIERVGGGPEPGMAGTPSGPLTADGGPGIPVSVKLQIISTEHWSLLATRSLSWNESFSRSGMFLSGLSGATVALALVAQATSFRDEFILFALVLLPVVLFVGAATYVRLVQINKEDARWVVGMNLLRHAYLEIAPELEPYFISGWHDDEAGVMRSFAASPGGGASTFLHGFVTTPGMLAVVVGVVAGALGGVIGLRLRLETMAALGLATVCFVVAIGLLATYGYRTGMTTLRNYRPRFPGTTTSD